jgi:hypothetical protein
LNLKVLFVAFLCLFSAAIICNVAMTMVNAADAWSCKAFTHAVRTGYLSTNGAEPTGDPIGGGGGWPC